MKVLNTSTETTEGTEDTEGRKRYATDQHRFTQIKDLFSYRCPSVFICVAACKAACPAGASPATAIG